MARLLDVKQVSERTQLSVKTIYDYMRDGRFPQPIRLTKRCSRWTEQTVDDWINSLQPAENAPAA